MPDYFTLLRDRVTLKCRSIDRLFLRAYVPKLQSVGQVCTFLRWRRQFKIPSSAAFGKIGAAYVQAVHDFAKAHHTPLVHFQKGQNKEKFARPLLKAAAQEGKDRVVLIGIAQEKTSAWRSWKRKGQEKAAHPHLEWFCHLIQGFTNRQLVTQTAALLDAPYSTRRRRLKRKGLILKIHSHRYQLTDLGRRVAVLFTKTYGRVLAPGRIVLDPQLPGSLKAAQPTGQGLAPTG